MEDPENQEQVMAPDGAGGFLKEILNDGKKWREEERRRSYKDRGLWGEMNIRNGESRILGKPRDAR